MIPTVLSRPGFVGDEDVHGGERGAEQTASEAAAKPAHRRAPREAAADALQREPRSTVSTHSINRAFNRKLHTEYVQMNIQTKKVGHLHLGWDTQTAPGSWFEDMTRAWVCLFFFEISQFFNVE